MQTVKIYHNASFGISSFSNTSGSGTDLSWLLRSLTTASHNLCKELNLVTSVQQTKGDKNNLDTAEK